MEGCNKLSQVSQVNASNSHKLHFWSHLCDQFATDIPLIATKRTTYVLRWTYEYLPLTAGDHKNVCHKGHETIDRSSVAYGSFVITCGVWQSFLRSLASIYRTDAMRLPTCGLIIQWEPHVHVYTMCTILLWSKRELRMASTYLFL